VDTDFRETFGFSVERVSDIMPARVQVFNSVRRAGLTDGAGERKGTCP
jgi:hypothetical protein